MRTVHLFPRELESFQQMEAATLKNDRENPPKPKLRCRMFHHHWFTHVMIPGRTTRTICKRCKINKRVFEEMKA